MKITKNICWIARWSILGAMLFLCFKEEVRCSDLDTTTVEILIIQRQYEFGFPRIDTVPSITHIYRPGLKDWYVKYHDLEWSSDKKPILIRRMKRR